MGLGQNVNMVVGREGQEGKRARRQEVKF